MSSFTSASSGLSKLTPGTAEYRYEVEALKQRFSSCDAENPLDPNHVLANVTKDAAAEWRAEIDSQAAQRLSSALADLDRRYGVSDTIRAHPWPALALAAGVGFVLAETSLDQGAGTATSQATRGLKSSAGTLVDTLAAAATTTVTEALRGHLDGLVADLKQAIGAPTPPRA